MNEEEAVRQYFGQPGYMRFLAQLQRRYTTSTAGARGYVTLVNVTEQERCVLDEFYGVYSAPIPNETKRYSVKQFEKHLQQSRFALSIPDLLTILQGEAVRTQQEMKDIADAEWKAMIREVLDSAKLPRDAEHIRGWAAGLCEESMPGARTLRRVFAQSASEARRCLQQCLTALALLEQVAVRKPIRLPILAAQATGDAHALDWKYPLGRLFWWGLTTIHGRPSIEVDEGEGEETGGSDSSLQAFAIRDGYRRGGVADDDLSSQVMLYAPGLFGPSGERVLTLRQVEQLADRSLGATIRIYMVENPSVFAELVDAVLDRPRPNSTAMEGLVILCGNGQPSAAVIKLLDWLVSLDPGAELHYSGDLDPAGLSIAQGLQRRYSKVFRAWHMDCGLYERYAPRGIPLSETERNRIVQANYAWDHSLADRMLEKGTKLHQELWAMELQRDIVAWLDRVPEH